MNRISANSTEYLTTFPFERTISLWSQFKQLIVTERGSYLDSASRAEYPQSKQ